MDINTAKSLEDHNNCNLKITNVLGRKAFLGFAFPKKSPLLLLFNSKLQSMFESGEIMKIILKHSKQSVTCDEVRGKSLGFENIAALFVIIGVGVFLSWVILAYPWTGLYPVTIKSLSTPV